MNSSIRALSGAESHEPVDSFGKIQLSANVPIPALEGRWIEIVRRMQDGESMLLTAGQHGCFKQAAREAGIRLVQRIQPDGKHYRIWRIGLRSEVPARRR